MKLLRVELLISIESIRANLISNTEIANFITNFIALGSAQVIIIRIKFTINIAKIITFIIITTTTTTTTTTSGKRVYFDKTF